MSRQVRWLKEEIAKWRAEGLVDAGLAGRILARYPAEAERNWGLFAFSALGAGLVGLGVILFFAYNWQQLPKAAKLFLALAALVAAHGAAIGLARRAQPNRVLVESLHVLGTMLLGAGIWLIAQIYHIDEHYPTAFLVWSLGALALAWAMPSTVQGLLALFLVAFWAGVELMDFRTPMHAAPIIVGAGVVPLAWRQRSPAFLFWSLAVLFLVTAFASAAVESRILLPLLFTMGAAALVAGIAAPAGSFADAGRPLRTIGLIAVIGCLYVLSFREAFGLLRRVDFSRPGVSLYLGAAGAAFAGALVMLARARFAEIETSRRWQLALLVLGLAVVLAKFTFASGRAYAFPVFIVFNLIVLGYALLLILEGSEQLRPRLVASGCVLFATVTLGRYADLFTSLLARASVFVALGAALIFVGVFYARRRRAKASA
jgi:uncharacterized membrane protein